MLLRWRGRDEAVALESVELESAALLPKPLHMNLRAPAPPNPVPAYPHLSPPPLAPPPPLHPSHASCASHASLSLQSPSPLLPFLSHPPPP
jgi:hypothetical protein